MLIHAPSADGLRPGIAAYPGFPRKGPAARAQVRAGTARRFALAAGDVLTIVNDEGAARALLMPFGPGGSPARALIGLEVQPLQPATEGFRADELQNWLEARGRSLDTAGGVAVFDDGALPGERLTLRAQGPCELWLALPAPD